MAAEKPFHALVLDTGPLIQNAVAVSSLLQQAEHLYTTPANLTEVRDQATRARVQTTLLPFLTVRAPSSVSCRAVVQFSKKTGDYSVLSGPDLQILALAYEIETERNGGDGHLRREPVQTVPTVPQPGTERKEAAAQAGPEQQEAEVHGPVPPEQERQTAVNADRGSSDGLTSHVANETAHGSAHNDDDKPSSPAAQTKTSDSVARTGPPIDSILNQPSGTSTGELTVQDAAQDAHAPDEVSHDEPASTGDTPRVEGPGEDWTTVGRRQKKVKPRKANRSAKAAKSALIADARSNLPSAEEPESLATQLSDVHISPSDKRAGPAEPVASDTLQPWPAPAEEVAEVSAPSDDGEGEWITPSSLHRRQAERSCSSSAEQIAVATLTTDFAMQNVLLQMKLALLSTNMQRITAVRSRVLRCHGCFFIVKQPDKQFCPRCGQASLTRVTCSTSSSGKFRVHLKRNFQYNARGDRYSVPKPGAGSANGRPAGGGKGGWGHRLVLAEDQKEYVRAVDEGKRLRTRDLMDQDYLPSILTGERAKNGGRNVGAGRNMNSGRRV